MGFYDDFLAGLEQAARERFKNPARLAEYLGVEPNLITRWLNKDREPRAKKMGEVLDALGARLIFCRTDFPLPRQVHFVKAGPADLETEGPPIVPDDYLAVPLCSEAGAGPGVVPQEDFQSWFLISRDEPSIRMRSKLMAVRIAKGSTSMLPTLSPNDIVLVDRAENLNPQAGHIYLVAEPDGSSMVKRVQLSRDKPARQTRIFFYSDNALENPPEMYYLESDYGNDITRAIIGRVVWAWSDISNK